MNSRLGKPQIGVDMIMKRKPLTPLVVIHAESIIPYYVT
jgi:hypothetical protein